MGHNSPELKALVIQLAAEGLSASAIGAEVLRQLSIAKSRNAVIGIVHRAGAHLGSRDTRRPSQGAKVMAAWRAAVGRRKSDKPRKSTKLSVLTGWAVLPESRLPRYPVPAPNPADRARVSYRDFERGKHCTFIPIDPKGHPQDQPLYCGLPPVLPHSGCAASSYCIEHYARCVSPVLPRQVNDALRQRLSNNSTERELAEA